MGGGGRSRKLSGKKKDNFSLFSLLTRRWLWDLFAVTQDLHLLFGRGGTQKNDTSLTPCPQQQQLVRLYSRARQTPFVRDSSSLHDMQSRMGYCLIQSHFRRIALLQGYSIGLYYIQRHVSCTQDQSGWTSTLFVLLLNFIFQRADYTKPLASIVGQQQSMRATSLLSLMIIILHTHTWRQEYSSK